MRDLEVIIATHVYNEEARLPRLLASLANQKYRNVTVFIAENHSSDGTTSILQEYSRILNLVVVQPKYHLGQLDNFQFMTSELKNYCSGKTRIFYLGADDYFVSEDSVGNLVQCIQKTSAQITIPQIRVTSPGGIVRTCNRYYRSKKSWKRLIQLTCDQTSKGVQVHHSLMSESAFFYWVQSYAKWRGNGVTDRDGFAEYMALWDVVSKFSMDFCNDSILMKEINNRKDSSNRIHEPKKRNRRINLRLILSTHHAKNVTTLRLLKKRKNLTSENLELYIFLSLLTYFVNWLSDLTFFVNLSIHKLRNLKNS